MIFQVDFQALPVIGIRCNPVFLVAREVFYPVVREKLDSVEIFRKNKRAKIDLSSANIFLFLQSFFESCASSSAAVRIEEEEVATHLVLELRTCCLVGAALVWSLSDKCANGLCRFEGQAVPPLLDYPDPKEFRNLVDYLRQKTRLILGSSRAGTIVSHLIFPPPSFSCLSS